MKNLLMAAALGLTNMAVADVNLITICNVSYTTSDGKNTQLNLVSQPATAGQNYVLIAQDVKTPDGSANFYVYYDGKYAAISVYEANSGNSFNADSEVEIGKLFTLNAETYNTPGLTYVHFACNSKNR